MRKVEREENELFIAQVSLRNVYVLFAWLFSVYIVQLWKNWKSCVDKRYGEEYWGEQFLVNEPFSIHGWQTQKKN